MTKCCRLREKDGRIVEVFAGPKEALVNSFTAELLGSPLWIDVPGNPVKGQYYDGKKAVDAPVKSVLVSTNIVAARMLATYGVTYVSSDRFIATDDWKRRMAFWRDGYDPDVILAAPTMWEKAKNVVRF